MWIESHGNLARHPKTRRLMQRMGWTLPFTIGNLHLLWWWALDFAPTGDLTRFEPEQLTYDLDLGGATPEQFLEAMVAAGFLDRIDGMLCIHDWADYKRPRRCLAASLPRPANAGQNRPLPVPPRRDPPARDSAAHNDDATLSTTIAEQEPPSDAIPAIAEIPRVLDALPSFTYLWWPRLLDIYKTNGDPLSASEQRKLLARLARQPASAVQMLKISSKNSPDGFRAEREKLLENTS